MGGAVFPLCCLTRGQTMVEVMKIMATSFKRSHAGTATLSAPDPAAGHHRPTPLLGTPILWPLDAKNWLIGKDPDAGIDWRREKKGMTEDEMVGWHHRLNGHEFESAPGIGDGQGNLACCSPWGRKESDTPELLNWTELKFKFSLWGGRLESGRGCSKQRGWCVQALEARLRDQEKASVVMRGSGERRGWAVSNSQTTGYREHCWVAQISSWGHEEPANGFKLGIVLSRFAS